MMMVDDAAQDEDAAPLDISAPPEKSERSFSSSPSGLPVDLQAPTAHAFYRADIDGLRAIAILPVLVFHAFPSVLPGGFVGVDVFFVISGYLITRLILPGVDASRFSFVEFYSRRARRIFPSVAVVVLATLAYGWYRLLPDAFASLGWHSLAGAGFIANIALWGESGYFDAAAETKPLLHLWSLGIEEQFYLIWPIFLTLIWRIRLRVLVGLLLLVLSLAAGLYFAKMDPTQAFYSPLPRAWELLVGGLLAYWHFHGNMRNKSASEPGFVVFPRGRMADALSLLGAFLITIAMFVIDQTRLFPGAWALLPTLGAAFIIAAGPRAWFNRILLSNALMVWIGLISFQLYLWHWPLLFVVREASDGVPSATGGFIAIGASVVLAWMTYKFVDKPIRSGAFARTKTILACGMLIFAGAAGGFVSWRSGFPERFPALIQQLAGFHFEYASEYREGSCFLRPEQDESQFGACTSAPVAGGASVFLWGDSHAAHLYPGLRDSVRGIVLTQLTASACPPIVGIDIQHRPHCRSINNYVIERIANEHPDEVILVARLDTPDWLRLSDTVERLHAIGISRVVVVGPVPRWRDGLSSTLQRYFSENSTKQDVPQHMPSGIQEVFTMDVEMEKFFADRSVQYVSALKILCDEGGCLTHTGRGVTSLTAWDEAHLTTAGSRFLVRHFPASMWTDRP